MRRREFIALLGSAVAAWPSSVRAQQRFKIGLLDTGLGAAFTTPFTRKLVELGYVEGKNVVIERRAAEGNAARLKEFAADLVGQQVDVIVTAGTPAGVAAKQATSVIPIVLGAISDPVGIGLVASLARPGGNATGNSLMAPDLSAKRLDILHTLAPGIMRFAILWDSSEFPAWRNACVKRKEPPTSRTSCCIPSVHATSTSWMRRFPSFCKHGPTRFWLQRKRSRGGINPGILDFANSNRIPAMFEDGSYVEAGGLMSYGPDYPTVFAKAAIFVDKILKGAKPADLPVEQPTKFELVINLRTAKALGLEIPPTLIALADRVIE